MLGNLTVETILIIIGVILVSLTIHEMVHAWVGFKLGDDTAAEEGRISLNPIRHIDPFMTVLLPIITVIAFGAPILAAKPVPFNPERVKWDEYGAALIAAAGPFSNLLLAVLGALAANFVTGGGLIGLILTYFILINVSLFVFNLIPIPPLDGSHALESVLPPDARRGYEQLQPYGFILLIALLFTGALGYIMAPLQRFVVFLLLL